uniref:Uncharacterized protein n=1 Tax=Catharus ustulatus TaxID=91951 RepID=A0A8C3VJI9_CATUS
LPATPALVSGDPPREFLSPVHTLRNFTSQQIFDSCLGKTVPLMFGTSQATCWESGSLKLFDFTDKHSSRCEAASSSLFRDDFPHDSLSPLPRNLKTQVSRETVRK